VTGIAKADTATMKALIHEMFGEPTDVVRVAEVDQEHADLPNVAVRVLLSPIHNHDLATIRGIYGYKPDLPAIGGSEFLGELDGKRVVGAGHGAWAETIVAPRMGLIPVPDGIPDETAAQLIAMPLSAVVLFDELRVERGAWIAQNAANGAVGRIVMRLAQAAGVGIVNFVRSEASAKELQRFGAEHVIDTSAAGWPERARALTGGGGFARIIDSVAGPATLELERLLAERGELIVFGALSGSAIKLDPGLMISLECSVRGFWMSTWMRRATSEQRADVVRRVFEMALGGSLPLPVGGVYSLDQAREALKAAETPNRSGKILFRP
jgi:NADPH2:quinone reductase